MVESLIHLRIVAIYMDELQFQKELQLRLDEIVALPPSHKKDRLLAHAERLQQKLCTDDESMDQVRASLDLVRIHIKYMLFDIEATRRENLYLRQMLDQQNDDV